MDYPRRFDLLRGSVNCRSMLVWLMFQAAFWEEEVRNRRLHYTSNKVVPWLLNHTTMSVKYESIEGNLV